MKIQCNYCRQMVEETATQCPHCGAALSGVNRMAGEEPKTIEELKQWYAARNLPPENITRFFIGKNIKEPKAFGIYRDDKGDFVVYKNKADGSRAVRYEGADEAYAVNELYQRLKAEIADQKDAHRQKYPSKSSGESSRSGGGRRKKSGGPDIGLWVVLSIFGIAMIFAIFDHSPSSGYYRYNNTDYYLQGSSWYMYDSTYDDWDRVWDDSELEELITDETQDDYRISGFDHEGMDFEDTVWYDTGDNDDDDDWDSDSDWDWGDSDWDSGGTDWDSDW